MLQEKKMELQAENRSGHIQKKIQWSWKRCRTGQPNRLKLLPSDVRLEHLGLFASEKKKMTKGRYDRDKYNFCMVWRKRIEITFPLSLPAH